jgi:RNA polymerase sigma-70 factor (ECF subfamily)
VDHARHSPDAFAYLYDRYLPRVYRYVRARTASPEDAADLTQQVFLRAFDNLHRYRPNGSFASWLFRIARNAASDAGRRQKRRGPPPLDVDALELVATDATEEEVLRQERLARLRQVLATLNPDKRDLLALRFAAGLTSAEIAVLVGKSESAVKKQLTRIIDSLKERYRDELT